MLEHTTTKNEYAQEHHGLTDEQGKGERYLYWQGLTLGYSGDSKRIRLSYKEVNYKYAYSRFRKPWHWCIFFFFGFGNRNWRCLWIQTWRAYLSLWHQAMNVAWGQGRGARPAAPLCAIFRSYFCIPITSVNHVSSYTQWCPATALQSSTSHLWRASSWRSYNHSLYSKWNSHTQVIQPDFEWDRKSNLWYAFSSFIQSPVPIIYMC